MTPFLSTDAGKNGARAAALLGVYPFPAGAQTVPGTGGLTGAEVPADVFVAGLAPVNVSAATYAVTDSLLVRVDASANAVVVSLPASPYDGMVVGVRVLACTSTYYVTVAPGTLGGTQGVELHDAPGLYSTSGDRIADSGGLFPYTLPTLLYVWRQTGGPGVGRWDILATRGHSNLGLVRSYSGTIADASPTVAWATYTVASSAFADVTGATGLLALAGITPAVALAGDVIDFTVSLTAAVAVGAGQDYVGLCPAWNPNAGGSSRLAGEDQWTYAPATGFVVVPMMLAGQILVGPGQTGPWDISLQAARGGGTYTEGLTLRGSAKIHAKVYRAP